MAKGLEHIAEKISADPSNDQLLERFFTLLLELNDSTRKVTLLYRLALGLVKVAPLECLEICHQIYRQLDQAWIEDAAYWEMNILEVVRDALVAMGKHGKAQVIDMELQTLKRSERVEMREQVPVESVKVAKEKPKKMPKPRPMRQQIPVKEQPSAPQPTPSISLAGDTEAELPAALQQPSKPVAAVAGQPVVQSAPAPSPAPTLSPAPTAPPAPEQPAFKPLVPEPKPVAAESPLIPESAAPAKPDLLDHVLAAHMNKPKDTLPSLPAAEASGQFKVGVPFSSTHLAAIPMTPHTSPQTSIGFVSWYQLAKYLLGDMWNQPPRQRPKNAVRETVARLLHGDQPVEERVLEAGVNILLDVSEQNMSDKVPQFSFWLWTQLDPTRALVVLQRAQLEKQSLTMWQDFLDMCLTQHRYRHIIFMAGNLAVTQQKSDWVQATYLRLRQAWQHLHMQGFLWTTADGVPAFMQRSQQREQPSFRSLLGA